MTELQVVAALVMVAFGTRRQVEAQKEEEEGKDGGGGGGGKKGRWQAQRLRHQRLRERERRRRRLFHGRALFGVLSLGVLRVVWAFLRTREGVACGGGGGS